MSNKFLVMQEIQTASYVALLAALPLAACSRGDPRTVYADSASLTRVAGGQASTTTTAARHRFVLAPTGNTARYRVRERLVGHDLPNDAIGETKALSGAIEFDSKGKVIPQSSKFVLDAGSLISDKDRRDGFVRGRLLEADAYPTIVLIPTDVRGVSLPSPMSGTLPIEMTGDLTVHGVTRPTIWKGSAKFQDGRVTGSASTAFTFNDIRMEQPRVPVLLSVADTIRLEIDFNLIRQQRDSVDRSPERGDALKVQPGSRKPAQRYVRRNVSVWVARSAFGAWVSTRPAVQYLTDIALRQLELRRRIHVRFEAAL